MGGTEGKARRPQSEIVRCARLAPAMHPTSGESMKFFLDEIALNLGWRF